MHNQHPTLKFSSAIILLAGLFSIANLQAADQAKLAIPPKLTDFAYGMSLDFKGQDAVYQATLPLSVYQNTVRSDLGDLRVFNAQGEIVPHSLRQNKISLTSLPTLQNLPYFPLQGTPGAGLDQLSISIKRNVQGTLIDIDSQNKTSSSASISGYLLDASALKQTIQAVELDWPAGKENFSGSMQIEASDNLKNWHTIVRGAPLANMQFGAHRLLQKRIEFPALSTRYLRLSWPSGQTPLVLNSVKAELAGSRIDAPLTWLSIKGSEVVGKPGEYEFDLGAHLPLQRLRFVLPQMNTLVQAVIYSKANSAEPWHKVQDAMLYKLVNGGQELNNADIAVNNLHRYWLLRVEQSNGGLGAGQPELQAGWQPHQLLFVTRGTAPFQLAYGNRDTKPAEFQMQNLFPDNNEGTPQQIQSALTGPAIALGGEARLQPAPLPLPWKKWILWAVLGISVALLGWMAYRLVKQMENQDSKPNS